MPHIPSHEKPIALGCTRSEPAAAVVVPPAGEPDPASAPALRPALEQTWLGHDRVGLDPRDVACVLVSASRPLRKRRRRLLIVLPDEG